MIALLLALACATLGGAVAMATWSLSAVVAALNLKATWSQTRRFVIKVFWTSTAAAGLALTTAGLVISAMSHG